MNSDIFIIFDTEFTAWEGSQKRNWSLCWEHKELISISALKIKKTKNKLEIIDKLNCYIQPRINKQLSTYITNLTGITQNKIDTMGYDFEIVMEKFYTFSKNLELYSYGNDYSIIQENLDLYKIDIDSKYRSWNNSFFDIRFIFQSYGINTSNYTSGTVYKHFNLKPNQDIKIHDAEWDTYSLFLTLVYILEK
jgi:inhibitor of KinA sporulation pathway (predicted exonuclease)